MSRLRCRYYLHSYYVIYSSMIFGICNTCSSCEVSDENLQNPCKKYNHLMNRFRGTQNVRDCNREIGCVFKESDFFFGSCMKKTDFKKEISHVKSNENSVYTLSAELIGSAKNSKPLKLTLNQHMAEQAVSQIKNSHDIVKVIGKDLVISMLDEPKSRNNLGEILRYILAYESVRKPTRILLYDALQGSDITNSTIDLAKDQLEYWLISHDAKNHSIASLSNLLCGYLGDQRYRQQTVIPLLRDSLLHQETINNSAFILASNCPHIKDVAVNSASDSICTFLESDNFKQLAKEGVVNYLHLVSKNNAISKSTETKAD